MNRYFFFSLMVGGVLLASCQNDEITSVRVPKEVVAPMPLMSPPAAGSAAPMGELPASSASDQGIHWTVPAGWKEQPPSQMRVGSFKAGDGTAEGADISVVPLSGEAGGLLPNVNRWRGQISLAPLSEADLNHVIKTIHPGGRAMTYVEFSNQGRRLAAAIFEKGGQTWFFKMIGDDRSVESQKAAFSSFLGSLRFDK